MGTSVQTLPGTTDTNQPRDFEALFNAAYREYAPLVRRVVHANLNRNDKGLADDLMQETFLRIYRQRVALDAVRDMSAFLGLASRRTVLDHYKVKRNKMEQPVDTGHWSFANRDLAPAGGCYSPARTGFRTARIGGAL